MKALEKDRTRRYDSPNQMAEDIQRYLRSEVILARPPSLSYRLQKIVRKHRVAVVTVTAISALVLIGFAATFTQMRRAEIAEVAAQEEAWKFGEEMEKARAAERLAVAAEDLMERNLSRAHYHLAIARWDENRTADALDFLDRVPPEHRHFEWYLARRQFEGSDVTGYGHTAGINSVAFSPDGRRIVSGSMDNTIKLWDAVTGEEVRTLKRHSGHVMSVSFSPDGRRIVSGSMDNTIKLWDAATGEEVRTLKRHSGNVMSVSFSPDGRWIVSGSRDNTIKLWNAATGEEVSTLNGNTNGVESASFSPDGRRIVSVNSSHTIKLWDAETEEEFRAFKGHTGDHSWVTRIAFSFDGRRIVSGSHDDTIKLWDAETGKELHTLRGHTASMIASAAFSPDGKWIVSGSPNNTIKLWDAETGEELHTLKGHSSAVTSVAFSPNGRRIVSGSHDDTVKLWDTDSGEELRTLKGHSGDVISVSFSPNGRRIASHDAGGQQLFWDTETGEQLASTAVAEFEATQDNRSPDGRWLAVPSNNDLLLVDLHYKQSPAEKRFRQIQAQPKPRWHRELAEQAERREDWYAATFHRAWLLKLVPGDTEAFGQFQKVHERLLESHSGNSPPVAPVVEYALTMERGTEGIED